MLWGFLRTMVKDYSRGSPYPLRRITKQWCPHLRGLVYDGCRPLLFDTRDEAQETCRLRGEHGRPVRVKIVWEEP